MVICCIIWPVVGHCATEKYGGAIRGDNIGQQWYSEALGLSMKGGNNV